MSFPDFVGTVIKSVNDDVFQRYIMYLKTVCVQANLPFFQLQEVSHPNMKILPPNYAFYPHKFDNNTSPILALGLSIMELFSLDIVQRVDTNYFQSPTCCLSQQSERRIGPLNIEH